MAALISILFGPSGSGKSTLLTKLFAEFPSKFGFSVSHTTRAPRSGEVNGTAYNFVTPAEFAAAVANNEFIEHATFSGNSYGTTVEAVRRVASSGRICILDIEIEGVKQIKKTDLNARFVFVCPPSLEVLSDRLAARNTESPESLKARLDRASDEIAYGNLASSHDIKIVNDDIDAAYAQLKDFIFKEIN
ncbi:Guanylate kinase [Smittium mucronatum]|uniref:Guanylate kinase n=1 Tax=Smittium mucronatum TaxID=133383 RepID=A0A1R0GR83_9FUNG|nr:Guanylate kinase [Smittium mucronatum]